MSQPMIPYPFMNIVDKAEVGRQRYGEVKNDGGRDWIIRAQQLREKIRGMTEAEEEMEIETFIDQCDKAYQRGKLTSTEYDEIFAIFKGV